jgi:hypothetical protein
MAPRSTPLPAPPLDGDWRVVRRSGVLTGGFTKHIAGHVGATRLNAQLVDRFDIVTYSADEFELRYRHWPVCDRIRLRDGRRIGEGRALGVRFCTFELVRA